MRYLSKGRRKNRRERFREEERISSKMWVLERKLKRSNKEWSNKKGREKNK